MRIPAGTLLRMFIPISSVVIQAEDGIRDYKVTGVQTCALPISVTGTGIAGSCTGLQSMSDDRHPVRRVSVAQWTTYLLFACLALEAGTIVSRLSERALIAPAVADAQPLPADIAASDARWRAAAEQRADARSRALGTLNLVAFACTAELWLVFDLPPRTNRLIFPVKPAWLSPVFALV